MNTSFYTQEELQNLNFKSIGKNVLISKKASIYQAQNISIKSNVRIDDFVILSGHIEIGNYVHISTGSVLMCKEEGIYIEDFASVSIHSKILGSSDDFLGNGLVGPCVDEKYRRITSKPIVLGKYSLLGCNSIILPGGSLAEGVSVGALSLVSRPTKSWGVYFGIPARRILERKKEILKLEEEFLSQKSQRGGGQVKLIPPLAFAYFTYIILMTLSKEQAKAIRSSICLASFMNSMTSPCYPSYISKRSA
ncbi:galactoside O-acetyltransferase [Helicobacter sp. 11S03491-1]|uniref:acyltransferase n=1 Tax=Helicobacter sp. 11S03491-1 TaxID=1476196 RepID=UPI000BA54E2B|nr:galactoside O-acetyltransferase [Helicobacter sp. 11S03491-1]PAF43769.1 hypothetical protein BKH45_00435 [Helicobacter sp. 11S03491-1]